MKKMILTLLSIGTLLSCGSENSEKKETPRIQSFEFSANGKDTINVIDNQSRKQGIWLMTSRTQDAATTDTLFYVNDSLVPTK